MPLWILSSSDQVLPLLSPGKMALCNFLWQETCSCELCLEPESQSSKCTLGICMPPHESLWDGCRDQEHPLHCCLQKTWKDWWDVLVSYCWNNVLDAMWASLFWKQENRSSPKNSPERFSELIQQSWIPTLWMSQGQSKCRMRQQVVGLQHTNITDGIQLTCAMYERSKMHSDQECINPALKITEQVLQTD